MFYENGKMHDLTITYIGGGSRGWAWTFMTDLAMVEDLSGTVRLYDIDKLAAEKNAIIGNHLMKRPDSKGKWTFQKIRNLPANAIVETNAVFSRDSIRPVAAGEVPENVKKLLMPHIENHERIYKAALTCDKELVYEAFLADLLFAHRNCSEDDIKKLADDMINNTIQYLPSGWKTK